MDRDQMIAHLTLTGWEPRRSVTTSTIPWWGVQRDRQLRFIWADEHAAEYSVSDLQYTPCEWSFIPTVKLRLIWQAIEEDGDAS
jgi:hypothetical protein